MDQALPGEGDELRLFPAPPVERCCPFARAIEREALLARRDRVAVDQPGDDRRQLTARRRYHGLVEQRQAFVDPALSNQGASLEIPGQRAQIVVLVAVTD